MCRDWSGFGFIVILLGLEFSAWELCQGRRTCSSFKLDVAGKHET